MRITNFQQAARASLNERWLPISKAKSVEEMQRIFSETECVICEVIVSCTDCELHDCGKACCKEYEKWDKAFDNDDFPKAHKAALALVKRLKKIVEGE